MIRKQLYQKSLRLQELVTFDRAIYIRYLLVMYSLSDDDGVIHFEIRYCVGKANTNSSSCSPPTCGMFLSLQRGKFKVKNLLLQ